MSEHNNKYWIAVDWGTSNLRAWLMSDKQVLATKSSSEGMGGLSSDQFEPALIKLISDWLDTQAGNNKITVVACGMVGSQQGWAEAGYTQVPCSPSGAKVTLPIVHDPRINVFILSGLSQTEPADVMRGEETQISGFMAQHPDFSGLICMPGTHSKWAYLDNGAVTKFKTAMTGEIYNLLSEYSVLRQLVDKKGRDEDAFRQGVLEGVNHPELALSNLFSLRARAVLNKTNPSKTAAHLSGLLIGTEIVTMRQTMPADNIQLLGSGVLAELYSQAFAIMGEDVSLTDVSELTVLGLYNAWQNITKEKYSNVS